MKDLINACVHWKRQDPALAVACRGINLPQTVILLIAESDDDIIYDPDGDVQYYPPDFLPFCVEAVKRRDTHLRAQIMSFISNHTPAGKDSDKRQLHFDF